MYFRNSIYTLIAIFLLALPGKTFSQSSKLRAQLKLAEKEYKGLRFVSAIKYLNIVLSEDPSIIKAQEMMAYSNRNLRNYDEALQWFTKLCKNPTLKPTWALHYAEALANKERYEESESWYRKYLKLVPGDKRATSFVKAGAFSLQDNAEWKVTKTNLSSAAAEYSPIYYNEGLMFCSNRLLPKPLEPVFGWDQTPYTNLYYVKSLEDISEGGSAVPEVTKKKTSYIFNDDDTSPTSNDSRTLGEFNHTWLKSEAASDKLNLSLKPVKGKVNSRYNDGPGVLLQDGSFIFTRNNFNKGKVGKSTNGTVKLKLYTASGKGWTKIKEFPHNSDEYSVGHPAINKDGNIMIFASDMPGGYGGADLYYSVRNGANRPWGKPINLGSKVNTEGNELFPFWAEDGTLLFSSTGYAGFGGLDIFEVSLKEVKPVSLPKNLGAPINSFADDFGIIRSTDGKSGYFSSNRAGSDDIYSYSRQKFHVKLQGLIADTRTKVSPKGSQIYLRHANGIDTLTVNRKGEFSKELSKETDYEVIGYSPEYVSKRAFISTVGIEDDSTIVVNINLDKAEKSQLWVNNNCDSLKKVYSIANIYYDLDRAFVRDEDKPNLNKLVDLMKTHPEISVITASHCDSRASSEYNKALSLKRGEAARTYLVSKGIAPGRVRVEYYGKSRLVNRCYDDVPCAEEDQQLNRRTEFDVILNGVNLTQLECKELAKR